MSISHTEANIVSLRGVSINKSAGALIAAYLRRSFQIIGVRLARAFGRDFHAEAIVADRYACSGWNDGTERRLTGDILSYPIKPF